MRERVYILMIVALLPFIKINAREIVDMAGRSVEIPDKITKILPHDEKTGILIYPVLSDLMIGRAVSKHSNDLTNISDKYKKMKEYDIRNHEDIILSAPDIVLVGCFIPEEYDRYDRLSAKLNIPFVIIDVSVMSVAKTYHFLNNLMGESSEKSKECTLFLEDLYNYLESLTSADKKESQGIYLAMNENGLSTAPSGSRHSQILDIIGLKNVVISNIPAKGLSSVSIEQVMTWTPDYIFAISKEGNSPFENICSSALWKDIPAVKNNRVYDVCQDPYSWFGNPPSINIIPGLFMLANIFYNLPKDETEENIRKFYSLFYDVEYKKTGIY